MATPMISAISERERFPKVVEASPWVRVRRTTAESSLAPYRVSTPAGSDPGDNFVSVGLALRKAVER